MDTECIPLKDPTDLCSLSPTRKNGAGWGGEGDPTFTLRTAVVPGVAVVRGDDKHIRKLLPVECERLQGFPDGWTSVQFRGKPSPEGGRYKALGNSMAANAMRWIGERIDPQFSRGRLL